MAMDLYFDSYDFDSNERGFSAEEMQTVRSILSEGKRVWMAPIVIEDDGQLETLCVTRSKCRMWRSGPDKVLVYLTPADEKTFRFLKLNMDSVRKREERNRRCMVPGKRNDFVRCPECYHCDACPFGMKGKVRTSRTVSRDILMESELEIAVSPDTVEDIVLKHEFLAEMREMMRRKNERILQVFELKMEKGYDVQEVAEALGESKRNVYYFLSEAKRICREYIRQE